MNPTRAEALTKTAKAVSESSAGIATVPERFALGSEEMRLCGIDSIADGNALLPALAERFGVSRTPIREALLQLGAEGFIEVRPRRGAIVSVPTTQRLIEMFETMAELEAACGTLAARRLTAEDDRLIEAAHLACVDVAAGGDPEAYYLANRTFHEALYRASRNAFLAEQALTLHKRLSAYRRVQLRARNRHGQSLAEHAGILEAIREGNEELAAKRLRDHVLVRASASPT